MRIAVIDDTVNDRKIIQSLLNSFSSEKGIAIDIYDFESGEDFLHDFNPGKYDAVFCDIYMNGMSGIDTSKQIRLYDKDCIIVFLTMSNNFASESYEVNAFGYIIKPVAKEQLFRLLSRITKNIGSPSLYFKGTLRDKSSLKLSIPFDSIMYINIVNRKVYIHMPNETIAVTETISQCSQQLLKDSRFSNCCKGIIVNFQYVSKILNNDFIMNNNDTVPIRKRYSNDIKNQYMSYKLQNIIKENQ